MAAFEWWSIPQQHKQAVTAIGFKYESAVAAELPEGTNLLNTLFQWLLCQDGGVSWVSFQQSTASSHPWTSTIQWRYLWIDSLKFQAKTFLNLFLKDTCFLQCLPYEILSFPLEVLPSKTFHNSSTQNYTVSYTDTVGKYAPHIRVNQFNWLATKLIN